MNTRTLLTAFLSTSLLVASHAVASSPASPSPAFDALITDAKSKMMSDPEAALTNAARAQSVADSLPGADRQMAKATALWLKSEALTRMGRPKDALPVTAEALALLTGKGRQTKVYGDLLKAQAAAYSKSGEIQKALPLLHKAFAVYGRLGEPRAQAIILHNIGSLYYDARDYHRMLDYLGQAEKLYNQDDSMAVALHTNRGNALKQLGRFGEAQTEYGKALAVARKMGSGLLEVNTLSNIASAQILDKKLGQAAATVARAEGLLSGPALDQKPFVLGAKAQIALLRGDLASASSLITQSFAGVDPKMSTMPYRDYHETAFEIFQKQGQNAEALTHLMAYKRLDDSGRELAASTNNALMTAQFDSANDKLRVTRLEAQKAQRDLDLARAQSRLQSVTMLVALGSVAALIVILALGYGIRSARRRRREMIEANIQLAYAATHDALTGLRNRSYLEQLISADQQPDGDPHCAVLVIDLDRFKWVNDTQGHQAGDILLRAVADALTELASDQGEPIRLGGDEFAVILSDQGDPALVERLAKAIVDRLSQPFVIEGNVTNIGATVGYALGPDDADSLSALLRCADLALYAGKDKSRNCAVRFQPAMLEAVQFQQSIRDDLRHVLERGELHIVYQAIVDINTHSTIGYEALVRWHHPVLGTISPALFIPIAEETGLIGRIGDWILRTACAEAATWDDHLFISVNLSAIQINGSELTSQIINALASNGLSADRLELEVTEGVFLGNNVDTDRTLEQLRALGVRLALDDFGTGYSSLAYLNRTTFSTIKIDRSFVRAASEGSAESTAIIKAIVSLAREIGMATTAEGIETDADLQCMRDLGCSQAQGYLFATPVENPVAEGPQAAAA